MAKPTDKSPALEEFLEAIFGRSSAIKNDYCVSCGKVANEFTDALSEKEFTISGLCQECQDKIFNVGE